MLNQFQFCEENGVPFCVVIGESEIEKGEVTLRDMSSRNEVTTITHLSLTKHCWFLFFCCSYSSLRLLAVFFSQNFTGIMMRALA